MTTTIIFFRAVRNAMLSQRSRGKGLQNPTQRHLRQIVHEHETTLGPAFLVHFHCRDLVAIVDPFQMCSRMTERLSTHQPLKLLEGPRLGNKYQPIEPWPAGHVPQNVQAACAKTRKRRCFTFAQKLSTWKPSLDGPQMIIVIFKHR
jgi:hypothetical protein